LDLCKKYFHHNLFLVHRIDRPVSGLVLLAKNNKSAAWLSQLFKSRNVHKTYLALVEGQMPDTSGTLSHIIDDNRTGNKSKIRVAQPEEAEQAAITHYQVLGNTDKYTIVNLHPQTGRHHQIRRN
jgi:23S rRNA pseudouridine1911/1915/1917 synthase